MVNFDVEKMLSEGLNKDEIWKKFDAEIKKAQDRLDQKAKAEEEKKKKEAITERKRTAAFSALKDYFHDVGYDNAYIALDKNGIKVKLSGKEKIGETLKKTMDKIEIDYPSSAELLAAFKKMEKNFGTLDIFDLLS